MLDNIFSRLTVRLVVLKSFTCVVVEGCFFILLIRNVIIEKLPLWLTACAFDLLRLMACAFILLNIKLAECHSRNQYQQFFKCNNPFFYLENVEKGINFSFP